MFKQKLNSLIEGLDGKTGIVIKNLSTKEEIFAHNEDAVCFSASTIKIPILLELLDRHNSGTLDVYAKDEVTEADLVPSSGAIRHLTIPNSYAWIDYARLMIILSDNVATNKLIKLLGYEALAKKIAEIGMKNSILQRMMFDIKAREEGRDNFTTARDMQVALEYIYDNQDRYSLALDILKSQLVNDKLPTLIEPPIVFAHKTGELQGIRHDVGIMFLKDPILVSVLTYDLSSNLKGTLFHNQVGKLIWEEFR